MAELDTMDYSNDESTIGQLYLMCDAIDTSTNASETCDSDPEPHARMLCFQFICRYFGKFPNYCMESLEAIVKLCRDENQEVRKYAFKMLPALVSAAGNHAGPVAEALTLLMKVGDPEEQLIAEGRLTDLLYLHTLATVQVLAKYSSQTQGIDYRETVINYIAKQLPVLKRKGKLTSDVEIAIANGLSAALKVVDGDEFTVVVDILKSLAVCQVDTNKRSLFNAIISEAQLNLPVEANNADRLEQILCCLRAAKQFVCDELTTDDLIPLIFNRVLSVIVQPPKDNADLLSEVLRETVDLMAYCKNINPPDQYIELLVKMIECRIPKNADKAKSLSELPDVRMTDVEAIMLALYKISAKHQDLVINKLRTVWTPLLQISQLLQSWSSGLASGMGNAAKTDHELHLQRMALKSAENIIMILRIFKFGQSDSTVTIHPSWKKIELSNRGMVVSGGGGSQLRRKGNAIRWLNRGQYPRRYQPPVGRYSNKVDFSQQRNGYGGLRRGRFRRRFRRGWY